MDAVESEKLLRAAIVRAQSEGLAIVPGTLGGRDMGCCCPLGAVILDEVVRGEGPGSRLDHVQARMGWSNFELSAFLRGFDHQQALEGLYVDHNQLGLKLRQELAA